MHFHRTSLGIILLLLCIAGRPTAGLGQLATAAQEIWPGAELYYRINPTYRIFVSASGTKLSESNYSDGALGVFVDIFGHPMGMTRRLLPGRSDSIPGQYVWFRAGYQYSATPPSAKDPFKESMLVTEGSLRFYLPWDILLSAKNRLDYRLKNEDFSVRYRPRLMIERDFRTPYLFCTASLFGEYFVNFNNSSVNRFRIQAGLEFKVFKTMNYEVYWNHQFANAPEINELDAMGMTLKFYVHHKQRKPKAVPKTTDTSPL